MGERTAHVHLKYGLDVARYRQQSLRGEVPDVTPYGFHHAESMGWRLTYSVDTPESAIGNFLRRALTRLLGFDILHAYRNRRLITGADIVWTMEEVQFLAVCALPLAVPGAPRVRLIGQTVWLFNKWHTFSAFRCNMLRRLLLRADALTFHSRQYVDIVRKLVPGSEPCLLPFGISLDSFPWNEPDVSLHMPRRILAMGSDPTRDWKTLLAAFGNDDRFEIVVICGWLTDATAAQYKNLRVPRNPTMQEFRELYQWADLVVVPMVANLYSGITVALEATSLGVPVLSSDTGGIPTYFSAEEMIYVPPSDPVALRERVLACTVEELLGYVHRAQARFRKQDYSTRGMAARYVQLSEHLLKS